MVATVRTRRGALYDGQLVLHVSDQFGLGGSHVGTSTSTAPHVGTGTNSTTATICSP
jgi:hypothetical protein